MNEITAKQLHRFDEEVKKNMLSAAEAGKRLSIIYRKLNEEYTCLLDNLIKMRIK